MTTSSKDLLLVLGIVVAIIISIATWLNNSSSQATIQVKSPLPPKQHTSKALKSLGRAVINLTRSDKLQW